VVSLVVSRRTYLRHAALAEVALDFLSFVPAANIFSTCTAWDAFWAA
jgi:hypothetical protein